MILSIGKRRSRRRGKLLETRFYYLRYRLGDMPVGSGQTRGISLNRRSQRAQRFSFRFSPVVYRLNHVSQICSGKNPPGHAVGHLHLIFSVKPQAFWNCGCMLRTLAKLAKVNRDFSSQFSAFSASSCSKFLKRNAYTVTDIKWSERRDSNLPRKTHNLRKLNLLRMMVKRAIHNHAHRFRAMTGATCRK